MFASGFSHQPHHLSAGAPAMAPPPPSAEAAYASYARNTSAGMRVEELKTLLSDLGLLQGRPAAEAAAFVAAQFAAADRRTKDGRLDAQEFAAYYSKVTAPRLLDVLSADMPAELERLRSVFLGFAAFGAPRGTVPPTELDGARFIKLCKESGLVGRQLSATDCDLIFAKAKERAARKVTFEQFLDCLDMVASKVKAQLPAVVARMAAAGGPSASGATAAEFVRFHDDLSTYTGMYARRSSLGAESGRQTPPAAASGGGSARRTSTGAGLSAGPRSGRQQSSSSVGDKAQACTPGVDSRDRLKDTFRAFAAFGQGSSPLAGKAGLEMDSKQFAKLCRDAGLLDSRLTATAADLAFVAKAKPLGARRIGFKQFLEAMEQLAVEKGVQKEELLAQIACCPGPSINGALTPEQTAVPFGSRRASAAASPPAADGSGACVQEQPAAPAAPAAAALLDDSAADLAADTEAVTLAEEGQEEGSPAGDAAEAADGMSKLNIGGGRVINITASAM
ncbi:hypothetical protein ABPG75_003443 [Micractinium tetrahymenae]